MRPPIQNAVDYQTITRKVLHNQDPIFVRNGGNDAFGGTTELTAVETLNRCFELMNIVDGGYSRNYIEATGYKDTLIDPGTGSGEYWSLPVTSALTGNALSRSGAFDNGKQDFTNYPIEIYADPELVLDITVTGISTDPDTGLFLITVSDTLIVDAHKGQMISGNIAEWGSIHSNTANTISVASTFLGTTTNVGIYKQSCEIMFSTLFGLTLTHRGPVAMNGIKFIGGNVRNYIDRYSYFQMCSFEGFYIDGSGGIASCWACYFNGGVISMEGVAVEFHDSVFEGCTFTAHGSGGSGKNTLSYCILDGCNAYGSGNLESSFDIEVEHTLIQNGTSHGIQKMSPQRCRVSYTKIQNCANDAVNAEVGGGSVRLDTVVGAGNGGVGLRLANGAQAQLIGVNAVAGAGGDLKVGGSAVSGWGDAVPRTDVLETNPEFCRVYS